MKKEVKEWIEFADDNLKSAEILLENGLYNPCLQNVQQSIEKYLKSAILEKGSGLVKTHSIRELINKLKIIGMQTSITDDDMDIIDSIYLPSKYPSLSVLPEFMPDDTICRHCLVIAVNVKNDVMKYLQ